MAGPFTPFETCILQLLEFAEGDHHVLPNVNSVIEREVEKTDLQHRAALVAQLHGYARGCYMPAMHYFADRIRSHCSIYLKLGKAARPFHPAKAAVLSAQAIEESIGELSQFRVFRSYATQLRVEFPAYRAALDGMDGTVNAWSWWGLQGSDEACPFATWKACAAIFVLLQPSSAGVERVFSILNSIGDGNKKMLEDAVEATCMLIYNDRGGRGGEVDMNRV
jgi:hypothetical protein